MTSRIDDLIADLASVRDSDITSEPLGPGGKALLDSVTATSAPSDAAVTAVSATSAPSDAALTALSAPTAEAAASVHRDAAITGTSSPYGTSVSAPNEEAVTVAASSDVAVTPAGPPTQRPRTGWLTLTRRRRNGPPTEVSRVGVPTGRRGLGMLTGRGRSALPTERQGTVSPAGLPDSDLPIGRGRSGLLAGSRPGMRLAVGAVAAAGVAAAVVVAMGGSDSGPLRSYANAAVSVHATGRTYEVQVNDAYADQRKFAEAFAKVGLDARLRIVPVSPGAERTVILEGPLHEPKGGMPPGGLSGTSTTVMKCPPAEAGACPLRVRLGGEMFLREGADIVIGRKARPGELYENVSGVVGDHPKSLGLTGRTAAQALKELHRRGYSVAFWFGKFKPDGSGVQWDAPATWRPSGERRITGSWMRSSNSVGLLLEPIKGDPEARPVG